LFNAKRQPNRPPGTCHFKERMPSPVSLPCGPARERRRGDEESAFCFCLWSFFGSQISLVGQRHLPVKHCAVEKREGASRFPAASSRRVGSSILASLSEAGGDVLLPSANKPLPPRSPSSAKRHLECTLALEHCKRSASLAACPHTRKRLGFSHLPANPI
jgi:hypothetical protein